MSNLPYRFEIEQESGGWVVAKYRVADGARNVIAIEPTRELALAWLRGHLAMRHAIATMDKPHDQG